MRIRGVEDELERLQLVEVEQDGKRFRLRSELRGVCGRVFQAVGVAIPPTVGFSVQVIKGTALTSIIGFVELSKASTMITNATFRPFVVYAFVALIYFALCWPLSK